MSEESKQGILSLTIKDRAVLYAAYMPFVRNGGLFVPTNKRYELGEEVFILLALMDEPEKIPINGTVVWITPKGAQGNRQAGIGDVVSAHRQIFVPAPTPDGDERVERGSFRDAH